MSLQINLDKGRCLGYGNCVALMPDVFDLPSGAKVAELVTDTVDDDEREDVEESVRSCPARAISFTEQ